MNFAFNILRYEFVVGRGRGLGGHADAVNQTPSHGSGEMRPVSVGNVGVGRGIQSNFPDGNGQEIASAKLVIGSPGRSKTPAYPGTVKDVDSLRPTKTGRLTESDKERFDEHSEAALFSKGQAGDAATLTFPEYSMTSISAPAANMKPVEHVPVNDFYLPPEPPEHDQHLGSLTADTIHSSIMNPGALNCEVLVISEYINPLESTPLGFDGEQHVMNSVATTLSAVTTAFLPGVHHPQKDSKRPNEPVTNLTFLK